MADVEDALYSILSNAAGLTALVSMRIYPVGEVPQDAAAPYVTYQRISDPQPHAMGSDPDLEEPRYQVNCYHHDYNSAKAIATQVKAALRDYSGTVEGVKIARIFYEGASDGWDDAAELQMVMLDVVVEFNE